MELGSVFYGSRGSRVEYKVAKLPTPVTLTHHITGETRTYDNIWVMYRDSDSRPYIIHNIEVLNKKEFEKSCLSQIDLGLIEPMKHPNVGINYFWNSFYRTRTGEEPCARIYNKEFCNPILSRALWQDSNNLIHLCLQLEQFNFNSPMDNTFKEYLDFDYSEAVLKCRNCGEYILPTASKEDLMSSYVSGCCPTCLRDRLELLPDNLTRFLNSDKKFLIKLNYSDSITSVNSLSNTDGLSTKYPYFSIKELQQNIIIPRGSNEVCVLGLGSAGSGLLDQLARTNMFTNYIIVDPDTVEHKNIRNQIYTRLDVSGYKSERLQRFLDTLSNTDRQLVIKHYPNKFENVGVLNFTDNKYIMLGFDTIDTRLKALEFLKENRLSSKYIIDARYSDLEASIYIIDKDNPDEMSYYESMLNSDKEILSATQPQFIPVDADSDAYKEFFESSERGRYNIPNGSCSKVCRDIFRSDGKRLCEHFGWENCMTEETEEDWDDDLEEEVTHTYYVPDCGNYHSLCKYQLAEEINDTIIKIPGLTVPIVENTCVNWNVISIYKYASTYITSAISEIEKGNPKPFTHIECQTKGIPCHMVLKS